MRWEVFIWAVFALVLIIAEVVAPGAFMLWLGLAAAAVMLIVWLLPGMSMLWQALTFVVLAVISVQISRRWFRKLGTDSDQPLLNHRAQQHIGRHYELASAIVNGQGKARVGDTLWLVEGPDLPAGATVEVVGVDGSTLKVKAVG